MKVKNSVRFIILAIALALSFTTGVLAGMNIDSPGAPSDPASQMYTIEQIYERLTTGAWQTKMTEFTEPASGPGATTGHSLDDVMEVAKPWAVANFLPQTGDDYNDPCCTGEDGETRYGANWTETQWFYIFSWTGVRYTDNGDGTITDNLTGLIWLQDANCLGAQTWADALSKANGLADGQCGLTDGSRAGNWRLPNINELSSLTQYFAGTDSHYLPFESSDPFSGTRGGTYWSSTTYFYDQEYTYGTRRYYFTDKADAVEDGYGRHNAVKTNSYLAWAVRGGKCEISDTLYSRCER